MGPVPAGVLDRRVSERGRDSFGIGSIPEVRQDAVVVGKLQLVVRYDAE